jgi:hypothetical protein
MRPSLALSITAVFAVVSGLAFTLAPAQMMSAFGLATPTEALIALRDAGVTLTGVGVINWLARNATGAPLRAVLWGNIFIYGVDGLVNAWEIVAGMIPSVDAVGLVVNLALVVMNVLALRRVRAAVVTGDEPSLSA